MNCGTLSNLKELIFNHNSHKSFLTHKSHEENSFENRRTHEFLKPAVLCACKISRACGNTSFKIPLPWRGGKIQRIFDGVVLITIKHINHNSHKSFLTHKNHEENSFENRRTHEFLKIYDFFLNALKVSA